LNYVFKKLQVQTKKRVEMKAKIFGQDVKSSQEEDGGDPVYKIKPSLVANLFGDWIMPLTKQVQVQYLLRRLEEVLVVSSQGPLMCHGITF
jgi:chorismate mutase